MLQTIPNTDHQLDFTKITGIIVRKADEIDMIYTKRIKDRIDILHHNTINAQGIGQTLHLTIFCESYEEAAELAKTIKDMVNKALAESMDRDNDRQTSYE